MFSNFWSTMDWDQRKIYVVSLADMVDVKRKMSDSKRRQYPVKYHLKKGDTKLQVCKNMFLSTLTLCEWAVQNWLKKGEDGMVPAKDRSMHASNELVNREASRKCEKIFKRYTEATFTLLSCELIKAVLGATFSFSG